MPRVEFVNLSKNLLYGPVTPPSDCCMTKLKSLVLNSTRLDWESVESLLKYLPVLQELHLSLNEYHNVLIDTIIEEDYSEVITNDFEELNIIDEETENDDKINDDLYLCANNGSNNRNRNSNISNSNSCSTASISGSSSSGVEGEISQCIPTTSNNNTNTNNDNTNNNNNGTSSPSTSYKRSDSTSSMYKKTNAHNGVRKLHFTGNPVTDWAEICRLGRVFPRLESLVLAECPLK